MGGESGSIRGMARCDRRGHFGPSAVVTLAWAIESTQSELSTAITHLRDVLGGATYESLTRKGETMTTAALATYAYDQIDQARAELNTVSE
jgi:hypothetical protein